MKNLNGKETALYIKLLFKKQERERELRKLQNKLELEEYWRTHTYDRTRIFTTDSATGT
jgi:hypothetical protein